MATRLKKKKASVTHPSKLVRASPVRTGPGIDAKRLQQIRTENRIRATITGTRVFDRTLHKTNLWLKEIMTALEWDNRERAYSLLRAVFHSLRDTLPQDEMIHLGAQLPTLLRGVYYEGWNPKLSQPRLKTLDDFSERVRYHLKPGGTKITNDQLQRVVHVIMSAMANHIGEGEMRDVKGSLKKKLRVLVPVSMDPALRRKATRETSRLM